MPSKKLANFGLFKEPSTDAWLLVQDSIETAIGWNSVSDVYSPPTRFGPCLHHIDLSSPEPSTKFIIDMKGLSSYPLYQFMMPTLDTNRKKILHVATNSFRDTAAMSVLQKMVQYHYPLVCPARLLKGSTPTILKSLRSSNLVRQVVTGIESDRLKDVNGFVSMTMGAQGSLILMGDKIPPYHYSGVVEFATPDDRWTDKILEHENSGEFELLGASIIRSFMRGEKCRRL